MIFDLVKDFSDVLEAMPREHPRYWILKLLDEAIRRDVQFIDQHPTTFFQCLWNTCWWYDCPEAARHMTHSLGGRVLRIVENYWDRLRQLIRSESLPPALFQLLESWRTAKERKIPGSLWLRSLRPPAMPLHEGCRALAGHERYAKFVDVSPDGTRVVSIGSEFWVGAWSGETGLLLARLYLSSRAATDVKFASDGTWFGGLSYYGRETIAWETRSLEETDIPNGELDRLLFDTPRRRSRYEARKNSVGAVVLSDTGTALAWFPDMDGWHSDTQGRTWAACVNQYVGIYKLEGNL